MTSFFSKNLHYLRKSNNITIINLSKLLEIPRSSISNYETGQNIPGINVLVKLCNYFKISPNDFLSTDLEKSSDTSSSSNYENINLEISQDQNLPSSIVIKSKDDTIKALNGQIESLKSQISLYEKLLKEKEG